MPFQKNGKKLFQFMIDVLKFLSFKIIISSNLTVINCKSYKLYSNVKNLLLNHTLKRYLGTPIEIEKNLSSSPYCYSRYCYPSFSVQVTQQSFVSKQNAIPFGIFKDFLCPSCSLEEETAMHTF